MKLSERLREGDVIYTNCIGSHLCYHVGIVYNDGKTKRIFHNVPTNTNKYGGTVCSERYEDFIKDRVISKVIRTNATNKDILDTTRRCREEQWDTLFFNCEDYVLDIVEGHRRSDIRDAAKIAVLGIVLIMLL